MQKSDLTFHGVFLKIFNIGVMFIGASGIGKSELALEFIRQGHSLIADDIIYYKNIRDKIIGSSMKLNQNLLAIDDIGIVDIKYLFGKKAISLSCTLNLIIHLKNKTTRKINFYKKYSETKILQQKITTITLHVNKLRNLYTLTEVAIKDYKQRSEHNYDAQKNFFHNQQCELIDGTYCS